MWLLFSFLAIYSCTSESQNRWLFSGAREYFWGELLFSFWFWRAEMRRVPHLPISPFGSTLAQQLVHINRAIGTRQRNMMFVHFSLENLQYFEGRPGGVGHLTPFLVVSRVTGDDHTLTQVKCLSIAPPDPSMLSVLLSQWMQVTHWDTETWEPLSEMLFVLPHWTSCFPNKRDFKGRYKV